ncbi:FAD-dependent oxidoreductase [bacterium]|nr:FAD-dependent oxidoreductase [bacterium]
MKYDVVVIGGGTAGCAVAYTAGIAGLKVLILEKNIHLGGAITSGLVVPAMNCGNHQINTDFFEALISELRALGGQITYQDNKGWFNPELTKIALDNLMQKANVDVIYQANISNFIIDNKNIKSIEILDKMLSIPNDTIHKDNVLDNSNILSEPIEALYYVDATGNCDFSKKLNCKFLENENKNQPMSLRFVMSGVDIKTFAEWIVDYDKDRDATTTEVVNGEIHLSTAYTWDSTKEWALKPLFEDAVSKGILKDSDRNYFQIFSIAGMPTSIAFNCPRIIENLDALSLVDTSKALQEGRQSIIRLANFCKKYLPGFENAYISNIADSLGIRVSRRIKGKYIYTIDDLKSGKKFKNPVLISNYPVDVHSSDKDSSTLEKVQEYQLPLESLMSDDYDNLFVVGRCISADFMAQGALRVQPSCFSMGVGLAKYFIKNR